MNECLLKLIIIGLIMECKFKDPYFEKISAQIWNVWIKTLSYFCVSLPMIWFSLAQYFQIDFMLEIL